MSDNRTLEAAWSAFQDTLGNLTALEETRIERAFKTGYRAALEAASWRPISEAPRNGTNFLAASPASSVFLAHYANGVVDSSSYTDDAGYLDRYATHWQPLPPPPAQQETQR